MPVKLTTIVDNAALPGLLAEHGYSLLIESGQRKLLFDTGQGKAFEQNAAHLNIDLSTVDVLVLSHGHYDHTGGLEHFLTQNDHARIIYFPGTEAERFRQKENGEMKYIGISNQARRLLQTHAGKRLCQDLSSTGGKIFGSVGICGKIIRKSGFECVEPYFFLDSEGKKPDPIIDDASLWIDTAKGRILICGCCHSGLVNTFMATERIAGSKNLRGVIGGLHLSGASQERITQTITWLNKARPDFLISAHCTGECLNQNSLSDSIRVFSSAAGQQFFIDESSGDYWFERNDSLQFQD